MLLTMVASICLALLAAFSFAAAGAAQHRASHALAAAGQPATTSSWLPVLGVLIPLLRHPIWLLGLLLNVVGFVLHSTALHLGSITIVQALLCAQLLFTLPLAAAQTRVMPTARDWLAAAAVGTGVVAIISTRGQTPQTMHRLGLLPAVLLIGVSLLVLLLLAARNLAAPARTPLIGTAAGIGFSLTAVLIVVITHQLAQVGVLGLFSHWPIYLLPVSGLVAAILAQDAFASGSLPAAVTAMTIADPMASWLWGAVLFDQTPPLTPAALGGMTAAAILISAGIALHAATMARAKATRGQIAPEGGL
ncbi:DMT family transporter [Rhizocola hellebori]|nr:DMT family transporter [Rhizocola hellebori]